MDPFTFIPCTVTDALGCQHSTSTATMGCSATRMDVTGLTRELVSETDNTVTLIFRYPQVGCNTAGGLNNSSPLWFSNLDYTLVRDGVLYASGLVSSVYQCPAPCGPTGRRLVFPHLPQGAYTLLFNTPNSCGTGGPPRWCQSGIQPYTIQLPNGSDTGVNVQVSAALGAAITTGGLMHDSLRADGLLPLAEPYSSVGYVYAGTLPGATVVPAILATTGATAAVDWVVVELRSPTAPHAVVASRPALIRRNGEVMDLDGDGYVNFPGLAAGSYRVALRHRNHLGVMSSSSLSLGFLPVRANFRAGGAYGTSPQTSVGGVQCLWPGDGVADGTIRYVGGANDRDPILTAIGGSVPTSVVYNVYSSLDVNMDGNIRYVGANNDRDPILQTVGGSVPTATRVQQLP